MVLRTGFGSNNLTMRVPLVMRGGAPGPCTALLQFNDTGMSPHWNPVLVGRAGTGAAGQRGFGGCSSLGCSTEREQQPSNFACRQRGAALLWRLALLRRFTRLRGYLRCLSAAAPRLSHPCPAGAALNPPCPRPALPAPAGAAGAGRAAAA